MAFSGRSPIAAGGVPPQQPQNEDELSDLRNEIRELEEEIQRQKDEQKNATERLEQEALAEQQQLQSTIAQLQGLFDPPRPQIQALETTLASIKQKFEAHLALILEQFEQALVEPERRLVHLKCELQQREHQQPVQNQVHQRVSVTQQQQLQQSVLVQARTQQQSSVSQHRQQQGGGHAQPFSLQQQSQQQPKVMSYQEFVAGFPDAVKNDIVLSANFHAQYSEYLRRQNSLNASVKPEPGSIVRTPVTQNLIASSLGSINTITSMTPIMSSGVVPGSSVVTNSGVILPTSAVSSAIGPVSQGTVSSVIPQQSPFVQLVAAQPVLTVSQRIDEIVKTVNPYKSTTDPTKWIIKVETAVFSEGLSLRNLVDNVRRFFEKSEDKEIKRWFAAYENTLTSQEARMETPEVIWLNLKQDLVKNYDPRVTLSKAKAELQQYYFSNESPAEYIARVRELLKRVEPEHDEARMLEILFERLPSHIALKMAGSIPTNLADFHIALTRIIDLMKKTTSAKPAVPCSASGSTVSSFSVTPLLPTAVPQVTVFGGPRGLCYFCGLGQHLARDCLKLKHVTRKIQEIEPGLTDDEIYAVLVSGSPTTSSTLLNCLQDRTKYMPPPRQQQFRGAAPNRRSNGRGRTIWANNRATTAPQATASPDQQGNAEV